MTNDEVRMYERELKDNSSILNSLINTVGEECPDCLCSMLNSKPVLQVLEDDELMITAQAFFEENLSIASTSSKVFIHRNTLIYRIEKIQRKIGLDIRKFEDALTLKLLSTFYKCFVGKGTK